MIEASWERGETLQLSQRLRQISREQIMLQKKQLCQFGVVVSS